MSRFSLVIAMALILNACGGVVEADGDKDTPPSNFASKDFPSEKGTIFGGWQGTEAKTGSGVTFRLFFNRGGQVGMEMVCNSGKGSLRSSATGSVKVDTNTFTVQSHLSGTSDGGCNFSYAAASIIYYLQDEILNTSAPLESGIKQLTRLW